MKGTNSSYPPVIKDLRGIALQQFNMSKLKVEGFESLVRDTNSNAIVNTSKSEFQLYMKRVKVEKNKVTN